MQTGKGLSNFLKRAGLTTGPLPLRVNNSTLSVIKFFLFGYVPAGFDQRFQLFGREFHKRSLEPHKKQKRLTPDEEKRVRAMVKNLQSNPVFKKYFPGSRKEHLIDTESIMGVPVKGTLDVNHQTLRVGCDPKSTSCRTRAEFVRSCFEYAYPRQDWIYCQIAKLVEFIFFGVQKFPPHAVWPISFHSKEYKEEYDYFRQEALFLLYFYKHYGVPKYFDMEAPKQKPQRNGK